MNQVSFHGQDDKQCATACCVIDGLSQLVLLTQVIWNEVTTHALTGEKCQGACPDGVSIKKHAKWLTHTQTESHWTTISTLKELIDDLTVCFKAVCDEKGLDFTEQ